jgi:hypothetical protein
MKAVGLVLCQLGDSEVFSVNRSVGHMYDDRRGVVGSVTHLFHQLSRDAFGPTFVGLEVAPRKAPTATVLRQSQEHLSSRIEEHANTPSGALAADSR